MKIKIALAGNPNSGKTTLFNALTGSNQFVGNWPGVTVEKKEGKLKKNPDVTITDLPGIYSLSPYTLEEVVARDYLLDQRPDAILNIVDGTNLERNLYLTSQLTEIGIPVVIAVNMMDVVNKLGDKIDIKLLSAKTGCKVVEISALKGTGITEAAEAAVMAAKEVKSIPKHFFGGTVEHVLAHIEEAALHSYPAELQRWYAIKIFERDEKVLAKLALSKNVMSHIEDDIRAVEKELDDDSESIITNERYIYIASVIKGAYKKASKGKLSTSDKIDRVITNRFAALPIFAAIMFVVYFISVTTVGAWVTDWTNDGLFGDGFHLLGIGASEYEDAAYEYAKAEISIEEFEAYAEEKGISLDSVTAKNLTVSAKTFDDEGEMIEEFEINFDAYEAALNAVNGDEPDPADYGAWVIGIPVLVEMGLEAINAADWIQGLVLDGIIGGVGAVLGFVPQILVLFIFLAFLEACGYMARIAFIMDRIFRKFGLSGKSFIPMLIGTGCSIPGIMASRTIENERDRRMTIITTSFMPCGAKLPVIALISGALLGGAWWVAPSAYFIGIAAIIVSGIMLKKTKLFSGDPAPFVMELPAYHMPTIKNLLRSMWERGWSFIKKAGTIILLSAIVLWFLTAFGIVDGSFGMVEDIEDSVLAVIGGALAWIFAPIGFGTWQSAVATITGLIAKENIVGTFGVLFGGMDDVGSNGYMIWENLKDQFSVISAYSFLIFNLLCAPCFAAIGAIRREMRSAKWTFFAIAYQTIFAYIVSLIVFQLGSALTGDMNIPGVITAVILLAVILFMLFRSTKNTVSNKMLS